MSDKIAVIGLGYVGLPLAVSLARSFEVVGFDIDMSRVNEIKTGFDRTAELEEVILKATPLKVTCDPQDLINSSIYIITVPTPVNRHNKPDLTALMNASEIVGKSLSKGAIVVFESTVYPGVTEEICGPILEKSSNLICGQDFYLGYSPERINPGDRQHTLETITKIVSGQTPEVTEKLAKIYGTLNNNNIFIAQNIKTAEAAKVIENTQRDINIAFMNEISMIFNKMGISTYDVLAAAQTKWNFLPFLPGLVGGHCIGVDPYYLAECAKTLGQNPEVILAGRRINDHMGDFIATHINDQLKKYVGYGECAHILVLGLTFKENVPDLRNSKVINVIQCLQSYGHHVSIHDPLANAKEAYTLYDVPLMTTWEEVTGGRITSKAAGVGGSSKKASSARSTPFYHCIIGAVPHTLYKNFTPDSFLQLLKPKGLIVDIKKMWQKEQIPCDMNYWTL